MSSSGATASGVPSRPVSPVPPLVITPSTAGSAIQRLSSRLHQLFFKLRDEFEQTFVIVTHNNELANLADRKLTIADGLIL